MNTPLGLSSFTWFVATVPVSHYLILVSDLRTRLVYPRLSYRAFYILSSFSGLVPTPSLPLVYIVYIASHRIASSSLSCIRCIISYTNKSVPLFALRWMGYMEQGEEVKAGAEGG
jgi:hypothetical protein